MTTISKKLRTLVLGVLLGFSLSANANEEEVCAPFKDTVINENVLSMMLQAAEDGKLYRIKPGSSKMGFCVNSPLGKVKAEFRNFKGGMTLQGGQQGGNTLVSIDVDSLETDSIVIQAMLKGESFFDAEQYPEILFASTGVEWMSENKAVLKGDLTMHGITKAVAFYVDMKKVKSKNGEDLLNVKATTSIQRSEFGMYTLSPMVDDRVSLCMSIDAYRHQG